MFPLFRRITSVFRHQLVRVSLKTITIYALFFSCIWPLLRWQLRFSKLYQFDESKTVRNVLDINSQRQTQAEDFLKSINPSSTKQMYLKNAAKGELRFAIGVVTISRESRTDQPMYLTQVMSRLHQVLTTNTAIGGVLPFICNVDEHPEKHREATYLSNFFPNITRIYDARASRFNDAHLRRTRHAKERQDYAFCLETALNFHPNYVILVEDDAYPHHDFYDILCTILQTKLETRIYHGEFITDPKDWAWLKLSVPYYRNDFHRDTFVIGQWVALTCTVSGVITLIFYIYKEALTPLPIGTLVQRNSTLSFYIVFIVSFLFFLPTIWTFGRPYYLKLRGMSPSFYYLEPGSSCCTQAVLYPSHQVPELVDFLRQGDFQNKPMDWAMDEYRRKQKLKQYLLTPNIFTHIGLYSSLNGLHKQRSFAYEYFND